ncbi:hypothetical protein HK101_008001 [Irineochytrium annulatum]|nr:hypothetical protein HK101_008001 [Irineochytrium annulatum]
MHPLPPTNVGEAVARHQQQHHPGAADFSVGTAPLTPTKTPVTLPTQVAGAVAMAALPAAGMPVGMAGGLPRNASTSSASSQGSASGLLAIRRRVSASEVKLSAALAGGGRNPSAPTSANSSANSSASSSPATSPQGRPGMIGGLTAVGGGKTRASLTGNSMGAATRRVGAAPQLVAAGSAYLNSHHRVSDFKRREELKHCFDGLLTVLPEKPPTGDEAGEAQETPAPAKKGKKKASAAAAEEKVEKRPPNRVEILWRALDYMTALSGRVEEMEGTIQGLTAELQRLRVEKGITVVENEIEAMEEDVPVEEEAVLVG